MRLALLALSCCDSTISSAMPRALPLLTRSRLLSMRGGASVDSPVRRLMLTSSGLTTPQLEQKFRQLMEASTPPSAPSRIAMIVTAQLAPSVQETASPDAALTSKRSPGELRRRRLADARKKGRLISAQLGVPVECIDCLRVEPAELRASLEGASCIWVTGGNTFFLWQAMRRTGLDALIRERVASGALYVGCSAGAIVAGRSIVPAFWKGWDSPAAASETNWDDASNLVGMGLANSSFFPHFAPSWAELVERKRGDLDHPVICLDEECAFISGDNSHALLERGG
ncbi:hypothetical protein AB1Y20_015719 [Prymnesium parvum]|uniref:Peptidase E n=1 Tax=Prymnesium parvum TaxID=97485 RepID=A0AB34K115_PRYPA|mmetsp:Transcript_15683/g.39342  ORF Transcript_15683/g.39342 Transcript_15683/m.39342 type:complete len:285 (+) Transcript_15683:25-879(+)